MADLAAFISQDSSLAPLSCATHMRGFIDPLTLVERIGAHAKAGARSSLAEQVRSLLRLAPGHASEALRRARALEQTPLVQALRHALGDDVEPGQERALFVAAARIRHPHADDARLLAAYGDMGPDGPAAAAFHWRVTRWVSEYGGGIGYTLKLDVLPKAVRVHPGLIAMRWHVARASYDYYLGELTRGFFYAATMMPGSLESFFAYGAFQNGGDVNAGQIDKAHLGLLRDRTTPVTPSAVKFLALALAGKEPGQVAMAVDALVAVLLEERIDAVSVACEMRWVLLSSLGLSTRYAKALASAARAHPLMPAAVCTVLCTVLDIDEAAPPKGAGTLLALLLELALNHKLALPAGARDKIASLKLTGKGKAAQKDLMARFA